MGVVNGQPVNAAITNAAFLNKNQADTMTFPLALTNNLALAKRDEASAATINALITTSSIVRITGTVTTINGAVAPTVYPDGSLLIISNTSGVNVVVSHESGSAVAANRFSLGGAALTILAGQGASFYYDTTASRWRPSAGSGSGGGLSAWATSFAYVPGNVVTNGGNTYICLTSNTSGATFAADYASGYWKQLDQPVAGRNYMAVGSNFESNTVEGWQLFTTTLTSGLPTGTLTLGSAASLSVAVTSTSPLAGVYSLVIGNTASTNITAGQGIVSQAYTIDQLDQAKVLATRFAYKVAANSATQPMNFSGTSSNTFAVYLYDVTNSAWIQPAGVYNLTQSSGVGQQSGTWQTPSNMTQFRLAILCVNTTTATTPAANTYQILFDEFSVGQQVVQYGAPITDWTTWTPTGTFVANTTYTGRYRRVGDKMEVEWGLTFAGAPTATTLFLNLPTGIVMDTTKIIDTTGGTTVGRGSALDSGVAFYPNLCVRYSNSTSVDVVVDYQGAAGNAVYTAATAVTNAVPFTIGAGDKMWLTATFPVAGWGSSVQMSNDTDTRVCAASAQVVSGTVVSANTAINFDSVIFDTHGAITTGTGVWNFRAPLTGYYVVQKSLHCGSINSTYRLYKNGVVYRFIGNSFEVVLTGGISSLPTIVQLNAGDTIDIRSVNAQVLSEAIAGQGVSQANWIDIYRLTGAAAIAAVETVSCGYISTSGQSLGPAQTTIIFGTKEWDSHSFYNPATGVATIPVSGRYRATLGISMASTAVCSFNVIQAGSVSKNKQLADKPLTTIFQHNGSAEFQCIAGDTLTFVATTTAAAAMSTSANVNYIYITRVGN